jgi:hypothetical protein
VLLKEGDRKTVVRLADKGHLPGLGRARLARELFSGRFRPGQSLQIDRIAVEHGMDKESVLRAFAEFQAPGMITLADDFSASVNLPDAKAMQEAYEVRAALEEIAGRAAAATLGGASLLLPPRNSAKGGWPGSNRRRDEAGRSYSGLLTRTL